MNAASIAIRDGIVLTMDSDDRILEGGHVLISGDRIIGITASEEALKSFAAERTIDARAKIVLPGLVNIHHHTRPMRRLGDSLPLAEWHAKYPDNFSRLMTEQDAYSSAKLAFCEAVRSGTTTILSMPVHSAAELKAAGEVGIRARLAPMCERLDEVERNIRFVQAQGGSESDLDRHWLGVEFPDFFEDALLRDIRSAADQARVGIHTHLSEHVKSDVKKLESSGFLGKDVVLAHCIQVDAGDIALLAKYQARIAHCPRSNMLFGNGVAPVPEMLRAGLAVGLGTDGGLNNTGREDMFEEMRMAAMLHRGTRRDAGLLTAKEVLRMATVNGAVALGMHGMIGSLEEGKKADVVIVDARGTSFLPMIARGKSSNLIPLIVFAASGQDVDTVLVDGRTVLEAGRLVGVNLEELKTAVQRTADRILSSLGLS